MLTDRETIERFILEHCECHPDSAIQWPEDTLEPLRDHTGALIASRVDRAIQKPVVGRYGPMFAAWVHGLGF